MLNRSHAKQTAALTRSRKRRSGRGQSTVEFALMATLSLLVLVVGVQFALIGQSALAVSQGSSALARYAAVNPGALGTYNGTATLNTAATNLLSPTILSGLTVTVNSYQGTTSTETGAPIAAQDRVVISMSYNAASRIFLPSSTLLGVSFPTTLTASESQLYE
jgi:Flp pilus assembly protein TadG